MGRPKREMGSGRGAAMTQPNHYRGEKDGEKLCNNDIVEMTCPLRRGIPNGGDVDTNRPCPSPSWTCSVINLSYRRKSASDSSDCNCLDIYPFNCISRTSCEDGLDRINKCNRNIRRVRRRSLLTRPCALYLFLFLMLFDMSDFNSLISANMRTVSGSVDIGIGVNPNFQKKNGLQLTSEILNMDTVFGNRLTELSESEEDISGGETTSEEVQISRTIEPQMLKRLESQFLNLFGMVQRPERASKKITVPKYLLDLYQKQSGTDLPTTNLNLPGRHTRTANTVRTFYHEPGNPKEYPWKGRENHIQFNLDSIPSMERVTGAELRVPFQIQVDSELVTSESANDSGLKAVRILIHDIVKPADSTHLEPEPISYPIDSKSVVLSKRRNGTSTFWLTFDVFPAVTRWMSNGKKNHGLVLEILGVTNKGEFVPQETVVSRHNLRVRRDLQRSVSESSVMGSSTNSNSGESSKAGGETPVVSPAEVGVAQDGFITPNEIGKKAESSPVLFTYSDDGHNPMKTRDAQTLSRHYRSAQAQKRRKNHRNKNRKRNLCQRHAMFVDFQDVGWNDWIVAPPGYAAYYCAGECPFPMAEHLNATNHAVIQALVHSMNPALVPPPCCVPTKYSSLSLLYTDSSDKIVLKNYNEMVVDSCGCS